MLDAERALRLHCYGNGRLTTMDNDVTASSTTRNRQGRRRRNLLIGLGAAAVVGIAVVVGATLQNFTAGTSGALGARACPGINVTTLLPSIAPVPEVDWSNCNLVTARLSGAYLSMANLNGASLQGADLTGATLAYANLSGANLTGANLSGANLTGVNLTGTNLSGAILTGVRSGGIETMENQLVGTMPASWKLFMGYLLGPGANLTGAYLGFDLSGVNLTGANLTGANLIGARGLALTGVNLSGANLSGAIGVFLTNTTCPNGTSSNQFPNCTRQGGGL